MPNCSHDGVTLPLKAGFPAVPAPCAERETPAFSGHAYLSRAAGCPSTPIFSYNEGTIEIDGGLRADVLDPASPVRAEIVIAQAVLAAVDDRFETC